MSKRIEAQGTTENYCFAISRLYLCNGWGKVRERKLCGTIFPTFNIVKRKTYLRQISINYGLDSYIKNKTLNNPRLKQAGYNIFQHPLLDDHNKG